MVEKGAISYGLILTLVMALALSSTFWSVERAWADSAIHTISVGACPNGIAFNPTNNDMYVANSCSATVSVIDSSTNTVVGTINGLTRGGSFVIAFNPSNKDLY